MNIGSPPQALTCALRLSGGLRIMAMLAERLSIRDVVLFATIEERHDVVPHRRLSVATFLGALSAQGLISEQLLT